MKRWICTALALLLAASLAACGKQETPVGEPEPWSREGYFTDEDGNLLSLTYFENDESFPDGWYVGAMLGEEMYGNTIPQEGDSLCGNIMPDYETGEFVVTVSEEGEDGVLLTVEGGETYHFKVYDVPEATIFVSVNVDGRGNIDYAEGEELPEVDYDRPYQSSQINLAEPAAYTFFAWPDEGSYFIKWTKDGADYSDEPQITVLLDESADYVAVFESDEYSGAYLDPDVGEEALWIERQDDGTYSVKLSIFRLTVLDDGVGRVEDDSLRFTATDANGNPISGVIDRGFEELIVTFTDSTWPLIENGTTFTYETENAAFFRDDDNPVKPYTGEYRSDGARAVVDTFGNTDALFVVERDGGARESSRWDFTGFFDPDTLTVAYSDCVLRTVAYGEDGEVTGETVVYENGTGSVQFREDGTFAWHGDRSEQENLVFEPITD